MAKPLQKDRENRSAEKKDLTFHPFTISPDTARTAILLLDSKEPELLCQTLRAITKYASQDYSNRQVLYEGGAIHRILPHVDNPETNIKRFACKALAQLCQLPKGPEQVLEEQTNLTRIATLLAKSEDVFVLEFSSLVLAELTREPLGCEQLISANIVVPLFNRMKNSLDPDVQKNCLQVLSNVLNDPVCAPELTKSPLFQWPPLLLLMQSKYLAIQALAIRTVDQLVGRYNDINIQKSFRASTGVLDLCDILESYEFRDVHTQILGALKTFVETEENASHVYQSGCVNRLLAYLDMALPAMKPHCIAVLCKMSFTANGRNALFETGTDLVFCHHLLSPNMELLADAALGVANMCALYRSAVRMSETNIIDALSGVIADESAPWFNIRINALLAMSILGRMIERSGALIVEPKIFNTLRNITRKAIAPLEAQRLVMQCYINLESHNVGIKAMINSDFIAELLGVLQKLDIKLKILTCTALTGLMCEEIAKNLFTKRKGEQAVAQNLTIEHIGLRSALCLLITACMSEDSAEAYLQFGTIQYMVEEKKARYIVSAWEPAIEAIFQHHPSAKLAYTGRLGLNDFTREGFYVVKRLGGSFPTIQSVLASPPPHVSPVYVVAFADCTQPADMDIRLPFQARSVSNLARSHTSRLRLAAVPDDVGLREYLLKLRIWFGDPGKSQHYLEIADSEYEVRYREKCTEVSTSLKHRAQLLGVFVASEMSGLTQERDCSLPCVELALADLMLELRSRVIGLGFVKCGGALERAILYKVLADRIGLPCALVRATSAHAWCEIAVPEIDPDEDPDNIENYPAGLLRVNYIIDLINQPGALIPLLDDANARALCGPPGELYFARTNQQ